MAVTASSPHAVLRDIDWRTYTRLLRAFQGRRRFRLTYDRGTLEIMSPLWEHEGLAYILGRMIDALTEELQLPCRAGRSLTLRRRRKRRGLEPDNCYWIANAARLHGKRQLDLRSDPPPDLAIEIDITNSSLDRMSIYAALGVPEVWRLDATGLTFNILDGNTYQTRANSVTFPQLTPGDLMQFLTQFGQTEDTALLIQFRAWVRQRWLNGPAGNVTP